MRSRMLMVLLVARGVSTGCLGEYMAQFISMFFRIGVVVTF